MMIKQVMMINPAAQPRRACESLLQHVCEIHTLGMRFLRSQALDTGKKAGAARAAKGWAERERKLQVRNLSSLVRT